MRRRPLLSAATIVFLAAGSAFADGVLVHRVSAQYEDGLPGYDPDATSYCDDDDLCTNGTRDGLACGRDLDCPDVKDNVLYWDSSKIHVVHRTWGVAGAIDPQTNSPAPFTLTIAPGTIVKLADQCEVNANEEIVSCSPAMYGSGQLYASDGSMLQIDGVTLTDIRDDTVGGDTNKDGSATTPAPSYMIRFGGSPDETLVNSTIRYAALVGHFGSMTVEGNTFFKLGGGGNYQGGGIFSTMPPVRGAVPVLVDNAFELVSGTAGPGALDLRGQSAIVWGNTFTGNAGSIVIGPGWEDTYNNRHALPESGTTIVAHNEIATKDGILVTPASGAGDTILQQLRFRADIHDNELAGDGTGTGLRAAMFADLAVRDNTFENFAAPLQIQTSGVAFPATAQTAALVGLRLHGNSFALRSGQTGPSQPFDAFWKDFGTMIDAESNWWGHGSGPKDASIIDGLANPGGLGLAVSNGIDYAPFLAKEPTNALDSIHLRASALPPPPFAAGLDDIVISPEIDSYTLASSATGTVTIYVRDSEGDLLLPPVSKPVTSANHSVQFDAITLPVVPEFSSNVAVEAVLVPAGSVGTEVRSKPKLFSILQPVGQHLSLTCVDDTLLGADCDPVSLVPGNTSSLGFRFSYKINGPLHGHWRLEERDRSTGEVLAPSHPTVHFNAASAPYGSTTSQFTSYLPPLRDVSEPVRFLYLYYWAENDGGVRIGGGRRRIDINQANSVRGTFQALDQNLLPRKAFEGGHVVVGERPRIQVDLDYSIATTGVSDWEIAAATMQALDADGDLLQVFIPDAIALATDLATGKGSVSALITAENGNPLPAGAVELIAAVALRLPDDETNISEIFRSIPVREREGPLVSKTLAAGPSSTSFAPLPLQLNVTSNPAPASFAVEDLSAGDDVQAPAVTVASSTRGAAETRLVPLERQFSLYGNAGSGFAATVTLTYDEDEFPADPGFDEENLVVAVRNPLSGAIESLPSTHDAGAKTVTAPYNGFFGLYMVASETTAPAAACADPTADGKTTASDALFALRAAVGSSTCAPCVCDVNKNGSISSSDALVILKAAVGQIPVPTCLPC